VRREYQRGAGDDRFPLAEGMYGGRNGQRCGRRRVVVVVVDSGSG